MIKYTVKVYEDGEINWFLNGRLHREDGPAIEGADGTKHWYLNDKLHREDGPAVEYPDGWKVWYLNDKLMTEDEFNNRKNSCAGKVVEIEGKKYKLTEI